MCNSSQEIVPKLVTIKPPDPVSTRSLTGMNAEIEAMMAANKAAMEESQEEADISQEEMASRCVLYIRHIKGMIL